MKPTHPVELIACAIAAREGYFSPELTTPRLLNNPGDIRYAGQMGAIDPGVAISFKTVSPIATFKSAQYGITALFRQIWLQVAMGQTLRQLISAWAPPTENNTSAYLENVAIWTGLPLDTPILNLLPPLADIREVQS